MSCSGGFTGGNEEFYTSNSVLMTDSSSTSVFSTETFLAFTVYRTNCQSKAKRIIGVTSEKKGWLENTRKACHQGGAQI